MQLFKRALLSLFPDEIANQNINPASMFVSFISTKEFFSVINRKIVENYKMNLFDIALDPFEFKTGFWENPQIKQKDNDMYYSYCAASNLNGYRFLNCANISNSLTLITSIYTKDIFLKYGQDSYLNFLYTSYLLSFVFLSRIKIFPHKNRDHSPEHAREENYNRFIQTFFHFYEFVFSQTGKKISKEELVKIKKELLNKSEIFFPLFATYQRLNAMFTNPDITDKDLYSRIFYDELKGDQKNIVAEFIENYQKYTSQANYSSVETKIMQFILPADILIRYMFLDMDMFLVTETIISKIYDRKVIDKYIASLHKDDHDLESFLLYITDYRHFKKSFFSWVQKYLITVLRSDNGEETNEELDDLMSSIGDDIENLENFKIPERIKKESKIMEKILNFYITLIGGFRISRGDSFFLRLFRKPMIQQIAQSTDMFDQKNQNLYYYGSLLYNYGKNVFYYKYASENVRAGKQRFFLPHKSNIKNIYSNICILKLFDENFIATIFQDINPKDVRIFIKNKNILDIFRKMFGKEISTLVKKEKNEIGKGIYGWIASLLANDKKFLKTIQKNLTDNDIYHLKESIYNLDFRMGQSFYKALFEWDINLKKYYSDQVIFWICANCRETLLGLMLYMAFISQEENKTKMTNWKAGTTLKSGEDFKIHLIKRIYITDILNMNIEKDEDAVREKMIQILDTIYGQFAEILENRIAIDDNKDFLRISMGNRTHFIESDKTDGRRAIDDEEIVKKINGEDIIWFRWLLKNITYYNKRFLIPR